MANDSDETDRCFGARASDLAAAPPVSLDDPLEYLLAYHLRQRCICTALRRIASVGRVDHALALRQHDRAREPLDDMDAKVERVFIW